MLTLPPTLKLQLFGKFSLVVDETPLTQIKSDRLQALLTFLVIHRDTPQSRQDIAFTLWPNDSDPTAKANLRKRLHELRQRIPNCDRWLKTESKAMYWQLEEDCWIDIAAFDQFIVKAKTTDQTIQALETAVHLYQGPLLPSCYDGWIEPYRNQLHQQTITALDELILQLAAQHQTRKAIEYALKMQQLDPLAETAYCHLMQLYVHMGDRASALRVYHQCMTTLQEELGVPPCPNTVKLYEQLLTLEDSTSAVIQVQSAQVHQPPLVLPQLNTRPIPSQANLPRFGRLAEWKTLQDWKQKGFDHVGPNFLVLNGEPGIGKTRLLEDLAREIQDDNGQVLWGKGYEAEMLRPFGVWIDLFEQLGAIDFLSELKTHLLDAGAANPLNREIVFDKTVKVLKHLTNQAPVMVVIDDLQWLDETSIAFCHYAARLLQQDRVLLACSARTRELTQNRSAEKFLQHLHREQRIQSIKLTALDQTETLSLAKSAGDDTKSEHIFIQSGGNPFFILELARAQSTVAETTLTTDTIEILIQERLQQLDSATQDLIPWAAALGHSFNPTLLTTIADCPLPKLLKAIDQLEQHEIIRPGGHQDGDLSYNFAHDIVRQVAYQQFSAPRRQLIHNHIAQVLNEVATPTSPLINDVSYHADLGQNHEIAARASLAAAERCARIFAYSEVTELTLRGIRHCHSLETAQRIHYHLHLCRAWVSVGVVKDQAIVFQQNLERLIQEADDLGLQAEKEIGLEALIIFNYEHGNFEGIQEQSLQVSQLGQTTSPSKNTFSMLARSACCLAGIEQEMPRAKALLVDVEAIRDRLELDVASMDILFTQGCLHRHQGNYDQAQVKLHQAWQVAQKAKDHWAECKCLLRLIKTQLEAAQLSQALDYCQEFTQVSALMGEGSEMAHAAALSAVVRYCLPNQTETALSLASTCDELEKLDSPWVFAYVQTIAAQWDFEHQNFELAQTRATTAWQATLRINLLSEIVLAGSILIRTCIQNHAPEATERYHHELRSQLNDPRLQSQTLSARAQASLTLIDSSQQLSRTLAKLS